MVTTTIGPGYDSLTPQQKARIAFMRFGLGPKPGGPALLTRSPASAFQALQAEVNGPAPMIDDTSVRYDGPQLPYAPRGTPLSYATCCMIGANNAGEENSSIISAEMEARLAKHLEAPVGFVEQLVIFWSNHFSVCFKKGPLVKATVGNMERVAIRPNVLGRFSDMLKAVLTHPAMICYLDNQNSVGRNSYWGIRQHRQYNENLAREILELHTLGIDYAYSQTQNYSQADVTSLANVITGWTVYRRIDTAPTTSGQFYFDPSMHQPGSQTVMQRSFAQAGMDQGLAVLDMLAAHPSTATHIARKLLQHFVCDEPDPDSVADLASVFSATGGNLRAVANALIRMDVAWATPLGRMRQPYPWMLSLIRGLTRANELPTTEGNFQGLLALMDQGMWSRLTPDGFTDQNYAWMTPNTVRLRKDVAGAAVGTTIGNDWQGSATDLAADLLCEGVSDTMSQALSTFRDPRQSLGMLFVTPEFMRR